MSFKKCKVVMLPTKERAKKGELTLFGGKLIIASSVLHLAQVSQHLYILSDEEIKEGEWYICESSMYPKQCTKKGSRNGCEWVEDYLGNQDQLKFSKKIIATTDSSLKWSDDNDIQIIDYHFAKLPQPSQSFIEKYVEEYNKGNVITDVMVEYETYHGINTSIAEINTISGDGSLAWKGLGDNRDFRLKINPKDNTITIRKVKDSWSRKEVIELLQNCWSDSAFNLAKQTKNEEFITFSKWIEENL